MLYYVMSEDGVEKEFDEYKYAEEYMLHQVNAGDLWICSDEPEEPDYIDDDMGFNPYMGCYDFDC